MKLLRNDDGVTLTEMIVASALFTLVIFVVGGIFLSQFSAQQQVSAVTSTTNDAQLAASAIDTGLRNSSGFDLTAVGSDEMLVARVAESGTTLEWVCQAWYYSAAEGAIRMSRSTPGTPVAAPTPAQLETWLLLVDGVSPGTGTSVFAESGDMVTVSFNAETGDSYQPIAIEFSSSPLAGVTENTTCY